VDAQLRLGRYSIVVSEPGAKPLASYAADDKPFLGIAQKLLSPVDRATINKLQSLTGSGSGVDVKTETDIVPSATRSMFIKYTIYVLKLRSNPREKLSLDKFHTGS
jgi:hypothetical protein